MHQKIIRIAAFICGVCCLVLGIAGVILPLVPGIPFLLMAGACFHKTFPELYEHITTKTRLKKYFIKDNEQN